MKAQNWWQVFLKHADTLSKLDNTPESLKDHIKGTRRLFGLLKNYQKNLLAIPKQDLEALLKKPETLHKNIQQQEANSKTKNLKVFYQSFSKSIAAGIRETRQVLSQSTNNIDTAGQKSSETKANKLGRLLTDLNGEYVSIMEARHQAKGTKGLNKTNADEADRLSGFLQVCDHWLKHLYALEYACNVLEKNTLLNQTSLIKDPLPLQFRLEQNIPAHTFRLIRASNRKPLPEDVSILDIINGCYKIPITHRDKKQLVDDTDVIRFIRLHSEQDNLLTFKKDALSSVAFRMYRLLLEIVRDISKTLTEVIEQINQTPMQDLESAFSGINPDECKTLLRLKFQSLLPGINEDRYHAEKKHDHQERRTRTIETMEDFDRDFQKLKKHVLGNSKSTLATYYWLRKMLTSLLRNNLNLHKKEKSQKAKETSDTKSATQAKSHFDFDTFISVGTSLTIGEEDIAKFYISPDDVITSEMSIQHVDRTDKWIAVRKSEKTHRLLKKDFFSVIKHFIHKDLNLALENFGFRTTDLNKQLLPEIHERLADVERIEIIRSGILGTTITNLDEFRDNKKFHDTLNRYFRKPNYDNIHYPDNEKLNQISRGLMHSNTSILQMKYRRVLKVREEIEEEMKLLKNRRVNDLSESLKIKYDNIVNMKKVIGKIQRIMTHAKPSLKNINLEPPEEYKAIKASNFDESFTEM